MFRAFTKGRLGQALKSLEETDPENAGLSHSFRYESGSPRHSPWNFWRFLGVQILNLAINSVIWCANLEHSSARALTVTLLADT